MAIQETAGCAGASFPSKFTHNIYSCKTLFIAFGKITFMLSIPSAKNFNLIAIPLLPNLRKKSILFNDTSKVYAPSAYRMTNSLNQLKGACAKMLALQKKLCKKKERTARPRK